MNWESFFTGPALYIAYVLVAVATVAAFLGPVLSSLNDPKSILKSLVGIGILVLLFFVGFALSDNDMQPKWATDFNVNPGISKNIGGALIMTYIMFILAFVGIVVSEISKFFK